MGRTMMMRALALGLAFSSLSACSDNNTNNPADLALDIADLSAPPPDLLYGSRDPANHPTLVTMRHGRGPVMDHIELYTVVWQGDEALGERINRFNSWMVTSDYWMESTAEYGVGQGSAKGVLVIPQKPPTTLDDSVIEGLINGYIASGLFPAPTAKTEYVFILNPKTASTMFGSSGCNDYGGYHTEARLDTGGTVPYLINLQCGSGNNFNNLTEVVSHEVSEAATDPFPFTAQGWMASNQPLGGEISDLCSGLGLTYSVTEDQPDGGTQDVSYFVTRNWSNAAAKAGDQDPCRPIIAGRPYFNVGVSPTNIVVDTSNGDNVTEELAEYQPYSIGSVGTIKWSLAYSPDPGISILPSSGSAKAGDTLPLKVRVDSTVRPGVYPLYLITESSRGGGNQWVSSITVQ